MERDRREQLGEALLGRGRTGDGSANCAGDIDRDVLSSLVEAPSEPPTVDCGRLATLTDPQLNNVSSPMESKLLYCLVCDRSVILVSGISSNRLLSAFSVTINPSAGIFVWSSTSLLTPSE